MHLPCTYYAVCRLVVVRSRNVLLTGSVWREDEAGRAGGTEPRGLSGLRTHSGGGVSGQQARHSCRTRDGAELDARRQAVACQPAAHAQDPSVAAAPLPSGRTGAVGHQRARLVLRARRRSAASSFAPGKTAIQHVESVLHTGRFKNPSGRERVNPRVSAAATVETRPSHVGVFDHVERVPVAHLDLGAGWIAPAHRIVRTPRRVCDSVRVAASPLVEQRVRGGDFCRLKKSERLR